MTRSQIWWTAAAIVLGAGALAARSAAAVAKPRVTRGKWVDRDAPRRIRELAAPIERVANWPGLGDYLAAISYTESRGNPRAGTSAVDNRARGWFGMRPRSARLRDLGLGVEALKDERYAVALAAWYAHRCRPYAAPGQRIDWLAIRRCWGYPSDVDEVDHPGYWRQFGRGLSSVGLPQSFMHLPAFPSGYTWPGIEVVLQAVGRGASA